MCCKHKMKSNIAYKNNKIFITHTQKYRFIQHCLHTCMRAWHTLITFTISEKKAEVTLDDTVYTQGTMTLNVFSIIEKTFSVFKSILELLIIRNNFQMLFHLVIS